MNPSTIRFHQVLKAIRHLTICMLQFAICTTSTWATEGGIGQWKNFGVDDGLASGKISSIVQDRNGYLWVTTHNGVSRYDGAEWKTFTVEDGLAHHEVLSIFLDRDGNLWFGTNGGGVSRYDGVEWKTFTTADGLADNNVKGIYQDRDGNLWFGTRGLSGPGSGVCRFDGQEWITFTTEDGLADNRVGGIYQDRDGNLWFTTFGGGVSRYDGQNWMTFTAEDGLVENRVLSITQDLEGNLWFGTWGGGVSRYDGQVWTTFTTDDGLPSNSVFPIFQDREGYLWFGTDGGGVSRYDGGMFTTFSDKTGLAGNDVFSSYRDREGNLWFGTLDGVSRYDGTVWKTFTVEDGLANNRVLSIYQDRDGNLWFGTDGGGVSQYGDKTWTSFTADDGLALDFVPAIFQDREGNLWFGTGGLAELGNGVSRYDGQNWTTFTTEDGLAHNTVLSILEDREGNLWFGTRGGGISRFDGKAWTTFTTEDGLADNKVMSIAQGRNGDLWIGTWSSGVSRYDGKTFTNFNKKEGLADNSVRSIYQDQTGYLWITTLGGGVSMYDGQIFQTITSGDGLVGNGIRPILQDRDACFWFGTIGAGGLTRYCPPQPASPPVFIDAIVANRRYEKKSEVAISSSVDLVEFEFHGISLKTRPGGMIYRYRLTGHDEDWQTTHARQVRYEDLPRGSYTFEVQAVDRDLGYSERPATVALKVHLPYERVGLISALSIALALIVWQGIRLVNRDRKLHITNQDLERAKETAEEAREVAESANQAKSDFLANISHEIRTPMNAILGYAQLMRRSKDLASNHQHAVDTIQKSGGHLLGLINEVLDISKIEAGRMELNPVNFDLGNLLETLGRMFEFRCTEKGLQWRLEGVGSKPMLVHGDGTKLEQVLMNLLGNARKFTEEGVVVLRVTFQPEDKYYFEVIDTGVGIAPEDQEMLFQPFHQGTTGVVQEGTGLGLAIAQRQVELMGGQLEVESAVGQGSRFYFTVVFPPAEGEVREEALEQWTHVERLAGNYRVQALVVDDVEENRNILNRMLTDLGAEVEVAEDGRQALERMEISVPDIVFLDIRMPVMGGREALERLRERSVWDRVKVVAISASTLEHQQQEVLADGFDDFIGKPFRFEQLCGCLAAHLGVEYEYREVVEEVAGDGEAADWSEVELPEELLSGLEQAAEFYSVTDMDEYFEKMEQLGEAPQKLATHLRDLRRQHDMEAILAVLSTLRRE